jgi:4-hydroxybenzoate decarboxylase
MRDYLQQLRETDQIRVIQDTVDPRFELAAITKAAQATDDRAVLFESVEGAVMPVVTNVYGSRRRLCDLIGAREGAFCARWNELVTAGPDGEGSTRRAAAVPREEGRMADLPHITYFEKDAGPYLTAAIFLARDPDSRTANLSFHRCMLVDDSELRVRLGTTHDLRKYYQRAQEKGAPLEAALLLGAAPEIFLAACASLPIDEDELALAARIVGRPLTVEDCRTIDLQVPADTEILIEGRFLPGELRPEGPFGEFMGYYVAEGPNHVFEPTRVAWRSDPVFHSLLCGSPEDMYPLDYALAGRIYRQLTAKLPGILNVACYPYLLNTVVQIEQQHEGHARQVLLAAIAANFDYSKTCIVVDEDVDPYDLDDVWWAYLTRGRADTRAMILAGVPGFYRDPHKDHWGRLAIDATRPWHRQEEFRRKRIPVADQQRLAEILRISA